MAVKMELKSLVGRSFKNTRNSGNGLFVSLRLISSIAWIISFTAAKVLGPEEQPRSATPRLCVFVLRKRSRMVLMVMCLSVSKAFLFKTRDTNKIDNFEYDL